MLPEESIHDMYSRFTILINKMKGLGRTFPVKDLNRKILRSLPKEWLPKRTAIEEARNLSTLPINELIGSLLSHENVIKQVNLEDDKRKKSLAFKSRVVMYGSESESDSEFDKEFALVSKRFHRMMKYKNDHKTRAEDSRHPTFGRSNHVSQERLLPRQTRYVDTGYPEKESQACYKCGKHGHIRAQCPLTLKSKEKAMKASWSDYDYESETEPIDDQAFMASTSKNGKAQVSSSKPNKTVDSDHIWFLDSGCSHHMSGKRSLFSDLTPKNGGNVIFRDNGVGKIIGSGTIGTYPSPTIHNVLLVDGLHHNLLSISQLCESGNRVSFESTHCIVERIQDKQVVFVGNRINNMYTIDLHNLDAFHELCLTASSQQEIPLA
ncbi:unnamed protein product [Linum tenue]|uniref:CCHC-type domain-containing protein n=1 Tax=Linum tenue TaxID=586396 RepID=A0AAV0INR2_9ROSI|nr:unnamed protein product [Linum tenue]